MGREVDFKALRIAGAVHGAHTGAMLSMPWPRAFTSLTCVLVTALLALGASAATPPDAKVGDAGSALAPAPSGDEGPEEENCPSAVARQERLASAAELRRMERSARVVTKETIAQAEALASLFWEKEGVRFLVDSTRRGDAFLERSRRPYAPRVGEVSRALCEAMAARDHKACRALGEEEASGCLAWLSLRAGVSDGCDAAPQTLRSACAFLKTPKAGCPDAEGPAREACARVSGAVAGLDAACRSPEGETACTWSGLLASLTKAPEEACDVLRPGGDRRSPRAKRSHTLCQAVLSGEPKRCPSNTKLVQVDDVATWVEARVIGGDTRRLVTNLQVDRPALCALEVTLKSGGETLETLSWLVSAESQASHPDWRNLETKASPYELETTASALCVLRQYWGP